MSEIENRPEGRKNKKSIASGNLPVVPKQEPSDAYERITERILNILENGVVPWQSPSIALVGFPRNFATRSFYQGINIFILGSAEFQSPYFLTYLQAKELGGQVRAGEKGLPIIKVGTWEKDSKTQQQEAVSSAEDSHKLKFLRIYTVFNACQIDGINFPEILIFAGSPFNPSGVTLFFGRTQMKTNHENLKIENDLGTFEGFNHRE